MALSRRHLLAAVTGLAAWPWPTALASVAPSLLLAQTAPPGIDPRPYLVSEKFDGVRALWDGASLRSRSGRVLQVPGWFTADWPRRALDGELWMGRGRFDALLGAVRRGAPDHAAWGQVRYLVFELPGAPGSFEQRAARLRELAGQLAASTLQAVEQRRLADAAALRKTLDDVVRAGGEGLMLHRADAPWVAGRSDVLLKLKPLEDAEARVIGHVAGAGKYSGMMGALWLQTPQGQRFKLGTGFSDALRHHPPPVGAVVTYTHRGLTSRGLPRFASFLRIHEGG
ncbi:MAG TPA: DNA ligase [Albitalea sp.]